tara:strand:- start:919 stop:1968 length:1050 start_codon:yes stop_codon:yes gene_type:complete
VVIFQVRVNRSRVNRLHDHELHQLGGKSSQQRRLGQSLGDVRVVRLGDGSHLLVRRQHAVQASLESRVVRVNDLRKDSRGRFVRLVDDVHVELGGVHAQRFVEFRSRVIVQVHGDVHGQAKESTPQLGFRVVQEFRSRLQDGGKEVTVSVFVLAPVFKVLEDRVQLVVRVRLQVSVDGDVSPVADLFGQVRRVHDKLRLEKSVLSVLRQETQIQGQVKVAHRFVQETGVSGFISGHERKNFRDGWRRFLQASPEFLVQKKAGEFSRARSLEKFDEDSSLFALDPVRGCLELVVADKVLLVEIVSELVQDGEDLGLVQIRVDFRRKELFHLVEICFVAEKEDHIREEKCC